MNKNDNPYVNIIECIENDDGSMNIVFEPSYVFVEDVKKYYKKDDVSEKEIGDYLVRLINRALDGDKDVEIKKTKN